MKIRPTWLSTATLGALALAALASARAGQERAPVPARDPALQEAIRSALHASGETELAAALDGLRKLAGPEHRALLPQLLLFSLDAHDTQDAMAFGVLAGALHVPAQDVVRALVPLLEASDPAFLAAVAGVLSEFEDRSVERGPNFAIYRPILEARAESGEGYPPGLVRHLFAVDPGAAFLLFLRIEVTGAEEQRPLLWSEHVVEEALWKQRYGFLERGQLVPAAGEALTFLARDSHWWSRLYAVQVLRLEPAFRASLPLEELARDPHPLVREVAGQLVEPAPR